jgi:glycosyltransferase involved in cell wall biosynthesis
MTKKILIITDNLPDQINGVVTTYKNIEPFAVRDGYTIDYIHPGRYSHVDCPRYNEVKLAYPKGLRKEIDAISPDHIHIATEGPMGMFARRYLTVRGYRYNTAYHTKFPEGIKAILGIPEFLTWPLIRWFHSNSNCVLTTTPSMVKQLHDKGFVKNIKPWTRGIDRDIFKPAKRFNQATKPVMLNVSRVSAEKNLDAFYGMPVEGTKIQVGDGPKLEYYKKRYPDVHFVGAKRGKELANYYQQADVFVFPSKWDTFGLVQIEAMACGTPVAAYPVQGPVDVIDNNVTGVMDNDLVVATNKALELDREKVYTGSIKWSWERAWEIFRDNLVKLK